MNKYLSQKIKILSFFSMILVVILHSHLLNYATGWDRLIQLFLTREITRIAVPLFFAISGFLFFINYHKPNRLFFARKIKSRIKSILIPYILWSILGISSLYFMQIIPQTRFFFTKELIENYNLIQLIKATLITPVGTYQLWFLRDLFLLILLSPLICWFIQKIRLLIILFSCWCWFANVPLHIMYNESFFFFIIGSVIAFYYTDNIQKRISFKISLVFFLLWIGICIYLTTAKHYSHSVHCIGILLGLISIWYSYDFVYPYFSTQTINSSIYNYSFFIYLTHEPLLTIIKKIVLYLGDYSNVAITITYFTAPIITILACIALGIMLKKGTPSLYSLLTGKR